MRADIGMSWRNNGNEIIIEALCPKELQPKDLKCTFTTNTLILEVAGKEIATGKLFAPIKPDESTWQFGEPSYPCTAADGMSIADKCHEDMVRYFREQCLSRS